MVSAKALSRLVPTVTNFRIHSPAVRYFDAVCRAGSIREAARRLNVASSAVSRQIMSLEEELGAQLFERFSNGLRLTSAGEILAQHVKLVLHDADRARGDLDSLKSLRTGNVELVTLEGLCHRVVPAAIMALGKRSPNITVSVTVLGSAAIPEAVAAGDADLGLAFEVRRRPALRQLAMARFSLGAVMRADSPLASRPQLRMSDLSGFPLILPKGNFANREQIELLLHDHSGVRHQAGSVELIKQLVLGGVGVAFMTKIGFEKELAAHEIVHVPLIHGRTKLVSELGLYARSESALAVAPAALAEHIAEILTESADAA